MAVIAYKEVIVPIHNGQDREKFISILAHQNLKTWVTTEVGEKETNYWVHFELPENNIKEIE